MKFVSADFATQDVAARRADYTFADLKRWKDALRDVGRVAPELATKGISHRLNRVELGVTNADRYRSAVGAELARLDIPSGAVHIEESEPIAPFQTAPQANRLPLYAAAAGALVAIALVAGGVMARARQMRS
ncbi:MAG: hypothetical protein ACRDQ7_11585 [Haloechinothrix sp.]